MKRRRPATGQVQRSAPPATCALLLRRAHAAAHYYQNNNRTGGGVLVRHRCTRSPRILVFRYYYTRTRTRTPLYDVLEPTGTPPGSVITHTFNRTHAAQQRGAADDIPQTRGKRS